MMDIIEICKITKTARGTAIDMLRMFGYQPEVRRHTSGGKHYYKITEAELMNLMKLKDRPAMEQQKGDALASLSLIFSHIHH